MLLTNWTYHRLFRDPQYVLLLFCNSVAIVGTLGFN